jgi:hypothetical protein
MMKRGGCGIVPDDRLLAEKHLLELLQHRLLPLGDPDLLEHVSPIEWENVILYGQYVLNPDDIR